MSENDWIRVEVCYALPERQWLLTLSVPASASAADAVERSGLAAKVPGGLPEPLQLGIWNKAATADSALRDGDRVEIYRPLIADPKEARRARAKRKAADEGGAATAKTASAASAKADAKAPAEPAKDAATESATEPASDSKGKPAVKTATASAADPTADPAPDSAAKKGGA